METLIFALIASYNAHRQQEWVVDCGPTVLIPWNAYCGVPVELERVFTVRSNRPIMNNRWRNAFMRVFALKKLVSKFKAHITTCAIPGKTFISLPFTGGISAFAVILPKPEPRNIVISSLR